jgi:hypothetical protein
MKAQFHNPATAIKCKFSNAVHRILEPNLDVKAHLRWRSMYQDKYKFTDEQKVQMFDQIFEIHKQNSKELVSYLHKRRIKKHVKKLREQKNLQ